ncbi:MAG: TIGR00730 family Rossman fold protein [SAR324 cluster bacterium]|nr:TIGR00730 family Rossman fold protein [SAR324 cluster bacterium]
MIKRICVFCGSSPGRHPKYLEGAKQLARVLVSQGIHLVYGGANVGVMGILADTVLEGGGEVTGIIPQALVQKEVGHQGLTDLRIVASMHERKAMMADLADGFIALPGGLGTLEELFEVLTWAQLGFHEKPCGLLNICGYYDKLIAFVEHAIDELFVKEEHRSILLLEENPEKLLDRFKTYQAPRLKKWIEKDET